MEYQWKERTGKKSFYPGFQINILSSEEFREKYPDIFYRNFIAREHHLIHFCKAEIFNKTVSGTFALPSKKDFSQQKSVFGYCILEEKLIFVDDSHLVAHILDEMQEQEMEDVPSAYVFLLDFMEYLIKDDVLFLQEYEEKLTKLEERLLNGCAENFDRMILAARKDLAALGTYYQQLFDVGETLQRNAAERDNERENLLFGLYAGKAGRLLSTVQMMKEYSLQLREMYQTGIDMRQNEIMQFLTVVTTIFMPLTLITGWYGMNFVNMPELQMPYSYITVLGICALIVVVEIWIFWKKRWFK